jgi:hypothetical protein
LSFHRHHINARRPGGKEGNGLFHPADSWRLLFVLPLHHPASLTIVVEIGGYIDRAIAHSHQQSIPIYIVQIILLLVAPALFAASIYMVLGRLILLTEGEKLAPIRARWLTKIFVVGDVLAFFVQSAGT